MKLEIAPGNYVVAVSGGVDSVVLLDLLAGMPGLELVVAHFDHGIRHESGDDSQFVATLSQKYGLPYEIGRGHLGRGASEDKARRARYKFLQKVRKKHKATAIITAQHADDALETLAFNVLRGTKRKGATSLQATDELLRPLLAYTKADILAYARSHNISWREDSTNADETYTRNWIRRRLLPRLSHQQKQSLNELHDSLLVTNREADKVVSAQLRALQISDGLRRLAFIQLPFNISREVLAAWLRAEGVRDFDRKHIEVVTVAIKTLPPGKQISIDRQRYIALTPTAIQLAAKGN